MMTASLVIAVGTDVRGHRAGGPVRDDRSAIHPIQHAAPTSLAAFHSRLRAFRDGTGARLTIIQIGDSHTAADQFTGRLRARFQAEFGDAGRGLLAPGVPESFWRPAGVRATQTGAWRVASVRKDDGEHRQFGLSGYLAHGATATDVMELTLADPNATFATAVIGYLTRPDGGHVEVVVDGIAVGTIATAGNATTYRQQEFAAPNAKGRSLTLKVVGDGPVDLSDWGTYRNVRGVELVAHGFVGAQLKILDRVNQEILAAQLALLDPALIILAFGTNEGYAAAAQLGDYADKLRARVAGLQRLAPKASVVLVMAPDANRIPAYCTEAGGRREKAPCRALTPAEAADYDARVAHKDPDLCRWHTPASYQIVRAAQRKVADSLGLMAWDWMAYQGGACGASDWHAKEWVHNDRVHLKRAGANASADAFYDELLRGFRSGSKRP